MSLSAYIVAALAKKINLCGSLVLRMSNLRGSRKQFLSEESS